MTRLLLVARLAVVPAGPGPVPSAPLIQPALAVNSSWPALPTATLGLPLPAAILPSSALREMAADQARERGAGAAGLANEIAAALAAPTDQSSLKSWLEKTHAVLRRDRPDLFAIKMRKAAESDLAFNRAFPQLFYRLLSQSKDAQRLADTPRLRLAGDLHAENVEIVSHKDGDVPQVNDFDDTAKAPAGLEAARAFVSAAILGRTAAEAKRLFTAAREAYLRALGMGFKEWAKEVSLEEAVTSAQPRKRHWRRDAGPKLSNAEAARARTLAGLGEKWDAHHREGAGLSSIGVRRTLLVREGRDEAWELKELREQSALSAFPGAVDYAPVEKRVAQAYEELRKVPVTARTSTSGGAAWLVRERQGTETILDLADGASAARALGGLAAQMQRGQVADAGSLALVADALSPETASGLVLRIKTLRAALAQLIEDGTWR